MTNSNPLLVLSVENDQKDRVRLVEHLAESKDVVVAGEATDAPSAMQTLQQKKIDVVCLVDLSPAETAVELTKQIRQSHPNVKVLIVTASDTPEEIFAAMDAGADGYLLKANVGEALEIAICSVKLGAVWLDPGIAKQVLYVIENPPKVAPSRILPTGILTLPLMPHEKSILSEVAASGCTDGVCMVDPDFVRKLRRFSPVAS